MTEEFTIIEKEDIVSLKFPIEDVLDDDIEVKTRLSEINRALSLGNLEHSKMKIFFSYIKQLLTTIKFCIK